MLTLDELHFLIELCHTPGISVPLKSARLAAQVMDSLHDQKIIAENKAKPVDQK